MTTETTHTCPGADTCHWRGRVIVCGKSRDQHPGGIGGHEYEPCESRCDAEVWRAAGCDALYQRTEGWYECNCVGGVHRLRASITGRLAPIMSAPETEAAWQGARVLLEEAKRRGWGFGIGPRAVTLTSGVSKLLATTHYDSLDTLPAAIGAAFVQAVRS